MRISLLVLAGGVCLVASAVVLAITQAPLGTPTFFALAALMTVPYGWLLWRLLAGARPPFPSRWFAAAVLVAVAARIPLAVARVDERSDMIRYLYDGRVQRLGYNPFSIRPSDSEVAWTHTDLTRHMPSLRAQTPYPAAAQLFFRLVVTIRETPRAMKLALLLCDLLTILVVYRWMIDSGRTPWLALAYAWNPLVILEVAHSGHIDALGVLFIATSAWLLTIRRTSLAACAFVLAVASKLVPIVLVPLYWGRVRIRDAALGAGLLAVLYLPFSSAGMLPLGAVPNVIDNIRFNGPVFYGLRLLLGPRPAAAAAVLLGIAVAAWLRLHRPAGDAGAWAWPMTVALAAAPVIYPWYLLYCTPFLFALDTLPIAAWSVTILSTYIVWVRAYSFHLLWVVPAPVYAIEYGVVLMVLMVLVVLRVRVLRVLGGAKGAVHR
ncbi:MAG: hypothetical protein DMF86_07525 [Acidobacteria bacterium]|nr:MAG: hypothetical protein DMF86_07525 [Acidobacteriota bacterium]